MLNHNKTSEYDSKLSRGPSCGLEKHVKNYWIISFAGSLSSLLTRTRDHLCLHAGGFNTQAILKLWAQVFEHRPQLWAIKSPVQRCQHRVYLSMKLTKTHPLDSPTVVITIWVWCCYRTKFSKSLPAWIMSECSDATSRCKRCCHQQLVRRSVPVLCRHCRKG